jgi:glycerol-3-phosphate acyltransferase PlsY
MIGFDNVGLLVLAYLLGSIPSAVWIGKAMHNIDVRDYGSGNAGATNTFRVLGKRAGIPVLLIDILKGFIAVKLAYLDERYLPGTKQLITFSLALGMASLLGHIFPVLAGFRGGKGVATLTGILFAIHPGSALICVFVFLTFLILTQYVSLSSMMSAMAFPVSVMFIYHEATLSLNIFSMFVCVLVFITHQKNIERLLKGQESKVAFLQRRKA